MTEIKQLTSLVGIDKVTKIKELYDKITSHHEFEFMFFNYNKNLMSYEKYIIALNFIKHQSSASNLSLIFSDNLDVVYSKKNITEETSELKSYRITVDGMDNINHYIRYLESQSSSLCCSSNFYF